MKVEFNQNNMAFGTRVSTISVFESTCGKILGDNGIEGFKELINTFPDYMGGRKAPGGKGYIYYAMQIGEAIIKKYPEINETTRLITNIISKNRYAKKRKLQEEIFPLLKKYGDTLDIEL